MFFPGTKYTIIWENPGFSRGIPRIPGKSRIFPEIPDFRGGPPGSRGPGAPKSRISGSRGPRKPGFPGSAALAGILGVFRGAAALLINVFFGQVLVCFFCAGRCGAGTPPGGVRGFPGSGPGILRIPDSPKNLGVI